MLRKPRLKTTLLGAVFVVAAFFIALSVRNYLQDRPIPGGIVAYRAHNREGMTHTYCLCSHKGYYLITEQLVFWYLAGHDSLQLRGEIIASTGDLLTVKPIQKRFFDDQKIPAAFTIENLGDYIRIVEPSSGYSSGADFTLKKTYLAAEVREKVERFDFAEWRRSNPDQWAD